MYRRNYLGFNNVNAFQYLAIAMLNIHSYYISKTSCS